MGAKWDSPMTKSNGLQKFPGETSGPGTYNDNPLLSKKMDGGFQTKFLEDVPRGTKANYDTPMKKSTPDSVNTTPPSHSVHDNVGAKWDTPFTSKNGKQGGK